MHFIKVVETFFSISKVTQTVILEAHFVLIIAPNVENPDKLKLLLVFLFSLVYFFV